MYSGGSQNIYGGTALLTQVQSGGVANTYWGGVDSKKTTISAGGAQYVDGSSYQATIAILGAEYIESGGHAYYTNDALDPIRLRGRRHLLRLGPQRRNSILSGGQAVFTTDSSGAGQIVYSGGLGFENLHLLGGFQYVQSGGIALSAACIRRINTVYSRGVASATQIQSGGTAYTYAAGSTLSTTLGSGGVQFVYGGSYFGAIATAAFNMSSSGGFTSGTSDGWSQTVYAGGITYFVWPGCGRQSVFIRRDRGLHQAVRRRRPGCLYRRTRLRGLIYSGGLQDVWLGGLADYAFVYSGGVQNVFGSAHATGIQSGGTEYVYAIDTSATISSGGAQFVYGSSLFTVIAVGGDQYIEFGGYASGTSDSWSQLVYSGGLTSNVSAMTGGDQFVPAEKPNSTFLSSGGQYVDSGGWASGTVISFGGFQEVYSGFADLASVYSGGVQYVHSGGQRPRDRRPVRRLRIRVFRWRR